MQVAPTNSGTVSGVTDLNNGRVRITLDTVFGLDQYDTITIASVAGMTDVNGSLCYPDTRTPHDGALVFLSRYSFLSYRVSS